MRHPPPKPNLKRIRRSFDAANLAAAKIYLEQAHVWGEDAAVIICSRRCVERMEGGPAAAKDEACVL